MFSTLTPLFPVVAAANVLGVTMLVPQAWRTVRRGSLAGLSASWIGAGFTINVGWLVYAGTARVWGLFPVSVSCAALYGLIALAISRVDRREAMVAVKAMVGVSALLGTALVLGGSASLGLMLATLYTVQFAPAAWTALSRSDLDGVAPATWIMSVCEAALWTIYGAAIADIPVLAGGVGAGFMSAIVVLRLVALNTAPSPKRPARA